MQTRALFVPSRKRLVVAQSGLASLLQNSADTFTDLRRQVLARTVAFHWVRNLSADIISEMYEIPVDSAGDIPSSRREKGFSSMMAFLFVVGEQRCRETGASSRAQVTKSGLFRFSCSRLLSQHHFSFVIFEPCIV